MANPTRRELLALFRNLTGERNTDVVTDSLIYPHLQAGLEAFNDAVGYYETDDTSLTLVAETQELDLPSDCILVRYVRWNERFLGETDQSRMRSRSEDWLSAASGEPEEYYVQGRKIGFVPKPSAAAVAAAATPTLRQIATPASLATSPTVAQLANQHKRVPVYFAVAEWFAGLGGDDRKSAAFLALFSKRVEAAAAAYAMRSQQP